MEQVHLLGRGDTGNLALWPVLMCFGLWILPVSSQSGETNVEKRLDHTGGGGYFIDLEESTADVDGEDRGE